MEASAENSNGWRARSASKNKVVFLGARPDARGLIRSAQAFIEASASEGLRPLRSLKRRLRRCPSSPMSASWAKYSKGYEDVLSVRFADPLRSRSLSSDSSGQCGAARASAGTLKRPHTHTSRPSATFRPASRTTLRSHSTIDRACKCGPSWATLYLSSKP